jgi:hypothetical protein
VVAEDDQPRLLGAALADRDQAAHALRLELGAAEDLDLDGVGAGGDLIGPVGEEAGGGEVCGGGLQVAGPVLGFGGDASLRGGSGKRLVAEHDQRLQARRALAAAGLEAVEAVGGEDRARHQSRRGRGVLARLRQHPGERARLAPRRLLRRQGGGDPQPLRIDLLTRPEADDQQPRVLVGVQQHQLLEAGLRSVGAEDVPDPGRFGFPLVEADRDQVHARLPRPPLTHLDLHRREFTYALSVSSSAGPGRQGPGRRNLERKGSRCPAQ